MDLNTDYALVKNEPADETTVVNRIVLKNPTQLEMTRTIRKLAVVARQHDMKIYCHNSGNRHIYEVAKKSIYDK